MNTNINEDFTDIRPATRALKQISMATLIGGIGHYEGTHHCALLMLDPDCVEMPPALLKDTVLQPVDKIVLLLIKMIARGSTGDTFLPTQAELARMANVASPDTIWRALLILRCSRWLTFCQKMWSKGGPIHPSAYVANAKPLPETAHSGLSGWLAEVSLAHQRDRSCTTHRRETFYCRPAMGKHEIALPTGDISANWTHNVAL